MPIIRFLTGASGFFALVVSALLAFFVVGNFVFTGYWLGSFEQMFYRTIWVIGGLIGVWFVFGIMQFFARNSLQ